MSNVDESLEQLLSKASPRPVPDDVATAVAREAVRAEWQAVTGKHRTKKNMVGFAVAATILVAVFSLFNQFRVPDTAMVQVASIQKSFGPIFIVGEQSVLTRADNLEVIHAGQTIVTGEESGIAFAWAEGGSLRFDANTTVEFRDDDSVYLHSGRVYFDSTPSELISGIDVADIGSFKIETKYGVVSHVGTQFMTQLESDELRVSVREGRVAVVGTYYPGTALRGQQLKFSGRQRPVVLDILEYGDAWDWIGRTSPTIDVDGKSAHEFLDWIGRELGRNIEYSDETMEQLARKAILKGRVVDEPAIALRQRMATAAFEWRYEEGTIYVSISE